MKKKGYQKVRSGSMRAFVCVSVLCGLMLPLGAQVLYAGVPKEEVVAQVTEETKTFTISKGKTNVLVEGKILYEEGEKAMEQTNEARKKAGMHSLVYDEALLEKALLRSVEASVSWSHTRPNGEKWTKLIGEQASGENLGKGYRNATDVVSGWMESKSHKKNLLYKNHKAFAVACVEVDGVKYWAQIFTKEEIEKKK